MAIYSIYNEASLLSAMQEGDEAAFTAIYRHYSPQVYLRALDLVKDPFQAEEVVQEIFTRIWQKKEILDPAQNFAGLLSTIATHQVLDFFRKIKRDHKLQDHFLKEAPANYLHIEESLDYKESKILFEQALGQLAPQQYKVYQLCKVDGRSYKEAAKEMSISPLTVKEYLVTANKIIRTYMTNHLEAGSAMTLICLLNGVGV